MKLLLKSQQVFTNNYEKINLNKMKQNKREKMRVNCDVRINCTKKVYNKGLFSQYFFPITYVKAIVLSIMIKIEVIAHCS